MSRDTTPIRDAACVILCDPSGSEPRLLLGKRRETQVFLPNKWVFPGGRVDPEDHALIAGIDTAALSPGAIARLPFIAAAVRELHEEAGLRLHYAASGTGSSAILEGLQDAPMDAPVDVPVGLETALVACATLVPLARAITPPGRPRRFDTWFFMGQRSCASACRDPDGELLDLDWFTLTETRALDLPNITRLVVEDVAAALKRGADAALGPFPFYFQGENSFERQLIAADIAPPPP